MTKIPSGASKDSVLIAISKTPSFNYTSHKKDAVVGFTLIQVIDNAVDTVEHTTFNGQPAYVLDQTTQPTCIGDEAGIGGGVRSGTVGGEVKPTSGSSSIFVGGKALVREGDTCTMNNENVEGTYVSVDASWADAAVAQAEKDGGLWAMSELIYQAEADALWINVKGDEKAYYEGLKKIAARDMVALDILTLPAGVAVKSTQLGFKTGQYLLRNAALKLPSGTGLKVSNKTISKFPESFNSPVPNRKGSEGFRWSDSKNKGNNVRIDKGNINNSQSRQRIDHVIVNSNGKVIGRNGKPIEGSIKQNWDQAHIPLKEYEKWKTWNSPE